MPYHCFVRYISNSLMEVNGEINNAHFLTLEANNAYSKFKGPKTHNRQIS